MSLQTRPVRPKHPRSKTGKKRMPASPFNRPKRLTERLTQRTPPKKKCPACLGTGKELDHKEIGEQMAKLRKGAKISAKNFAGIVGLSASYLSELEGGKKTWTADLKARYEAALA